MIPNPNIPLGLSQAELMFGRIVKSIYDELLPGCKKMFWKIPNKRQTDILNLEIKLFYFIFLRNVEKWHYYKQVGKNHLHDNTSLNKSWA